MHTRHFSHLPQLNVYVCFSANQLNLFSCIFQPHTSSLSLFYTHTMLIHIYPKFNETDWSEWEEGKRILINFIAALFSLSLPFYHLLHFLPKKVSFCDFIKKFDIVVAMKMLNVKLKDFLGREWELLMKKFVMGVNYLDFKLHLHLWEKVGDVKIVIWIKIMRILR